MSKLAQEFINFALAQNVLKFGDYTLKSGRHSPYFFNAGLFNTGAALDKLAGFYAAAIQEAQLSFEVIFGPAYKGIPLAAATAMKLASTTGQAIPFCYNRKEAKDHGEGGNIVGAPLAGNVILIDDVITAGTAIRESLELIQQHGAKLSAIVIAFDREERGQSGSSAVAEVSAHCGCPVISIAKFSDLIQATSDHPQFSAYRQQLQAYRQQFGLQ